MGLLNGTIWNWLAFEDWVSTYFDFVAYDRADPRDVVYSSLEHLVAQQCGFSENELDCAVDSFYTELENHMAYFFGKNQAMLAFNKMDGNLLILEVKNQDERYDTELPERPNPGHS